MQEKDMIEKETFQADDASGKDDRLWWSIILGFIKDAIEDKWNEFTRELMYENRFSSSHEIVKLICDIADTVTCIIPKDTKLYRARLYDENPLGVFIESFYKTQGVKEAIALGRNSMIYTLLGMVSNDGKIDKQYHIVENLKKEYTKWLRKAFKGFDAKESDMPPNDKAIEGRINPERISYLYLSDNPKTCIYEVRPIIGQNVSVAEFIVEKDLRIYDFAHSFSQDFKNEQQLNISLFEYICQQFSKPYQQKPLQYLPTQFLGELIKSKGYDGLRFRSSLHQNGINVVLFDNQYCKPISSDYITIEGIELRIGNPEMYQLEEIIMDDKL